MRVPLSWLRDLTPVTATVAALSDTFNGLGLVVEGIEQFGPTYDGIVTARVRAIRPHPAADRIRLVDVDPGGGAEPLQVACGAWNFHEDDVVPLATVGAVMPGGMVIKRAKIRGEWSNGMLCSARELGIGDDHEGILVLSAGTPVGEPLAAALGLAGPETVFDLAIEANRPDALCMLGVARDVAGKLGLPLQPPAIASGVLDRPAAEPAAASVDPAATDLCRRFAVAALSGVRVCASPEWVAARLTLAGMRPINNVVDASNYVMLELGAPSHPYDRRKVPGGRLGVRWAREGERLETLDGAVRDLAGGGAAGPAGARDGVIVGGDDSVMGIAGVMGGAGSEIADDTTAVLFEAAWWTPMCIARTAKRLGLRTEASSRFERGVDIEALPAATARFVEILRLTCPDLVVDSYDDLRPVAPEAPTPVRLRTARVNLLLGTQLDDETVVRLLGAIGFMCSPVDGVPGEHDVLIPSWRLDATGEVDLIEEIGRHHGYDMVPRTTPANTRVGQLTPYQRDRRLVRSTLVGLGAAEAWTATLLAPADLERAGLPADGVGLANPMVAEESMLRTSLLPGLLRAVALNASHRNPAITLFETGHVFTRPRPGQIVPYEREHLAIALAGDGEQGGAVAAKRAFDRLVAALRLKPSALALRAERDAPGLHPTRTALVVGTGTNVALGVVGEIDPDVAAAWDLDRRVGWLQVDLESFCHTPKLAEHMTPLSRFPSSDIDLAFVVADATPAAEVEAALRRAGGNLLDSVALFDVYRGPALGDDRRSLAFRLRFVATDRTLTEADLSAARKRCVDAIVARGLGTLRA